VTSADPVRRWLLACIVAVVLAVVVGGITRLTESGLSITEWEPVSGVLPPMSGEAWAAAYRDFLRIPQAETVHRGITLARFKWIYWWEWFHRLIARGVGLVFAVPYVVLLVRRRIPAAYRARLAALPVLTLAQGALGWYMVQSGLVERSSVSAYRLAAHLALALCILIVAVWTYAELDLRAEVARASRRWRATVTAVAGLVVCTVISGAFVAGLRAGRIFNTFPLMGGAVVPPGYRTAGSWWVDAFENPVAAQFNHRVLAIVTLAAVLAVTLRARTAGAAALPVACARALRVFAGVVVLQFALGLTTLLLAVPVALGVAHQLLGVMAVIAGVVAVQRAWGARSIRLFPTRTR